MKKLIFISLCFHVLCFGNLEAQTKEVIIPFSKMQGEKNLKIEIFNANIVLKGTNRTDVLVKYSIAADTDKEKGDISSEKSDKSMGLKKISGSRFGLEITESNNTVKIQSQNWANKLDLEIEVPQSIHLNIFKNIGEHVKISNIKGNVNVENNVGDVDIKNVSGIINASTNAGGLSIQFDKIPEPKSMIFNSTTGDIDITLPATYKTDLKMKTEWGEIYSDLEIVTKASEAEEKQEKSNYGFKFSTDSWTYATLNGGGNEMTLRTKMGSIFLRKN